MRSMTGMGIGQASGGGATVRMEIRAVNNRFLDLVFRMPPALSAFEPALRSKLQEAVVRGRVSVTADFERDQGGAEVRFDEEFIGAFLASAREVAARQGLEADLDLADLLGLEQAFSVREADPPEELAALVDRAFQEALAGYTAMREAEGVKLGADLVRRLDAIETHLGVVRERAEVVPAELRRRLEQRLERFLAKDAVDPQRLAAEVALLADKATVSEEIERMESHIGQFRETIDEGGAMAKRLGFLLQEMHREVNTTGSKSTDLEITDAVVRMKEELENLREQIQNLE